MTYSTTGSRANPNSSMSKKMLVLIPTSHVTARVNGGRLNVIGSPVRRTELPLTRFYSQNEERSASVFRHGHYRQAAMSFPIDCPDCKDDIILRKLQSCAGRVLDFLDMLPFRAGCCPPKDLVFGGPPTRRRAPGERGVVLQILR